MMDEYLDMRAKLKQALAELEQTNLDFTDAHKAYEGKCRQFRALLKWADAALLEMNPRSMRAFHDDLVNIKAMMP